MLSPQSWMPLTNGLAIGRRLRASHDCGEGKTLLISRDTDGYHAWCFRCGDRGWAPGERETLADKLARVARLAAGDALCHAAGTPQPEPACHDVDDWPDSARLWFYKAGLSRSDIGRIGAYYHKPSGRVVLPVYEPGRGDSAGSAVLYWQARALDDRQPKYLAASYRPPSMLARWGSAPSPTLCEDILSAYKVGQVGEGWAVMGTRIPSVYVSTLLERRCAVNLWLDPDKAGQDAAKKYIRQLSAYNIPVRNIISTQDPKKHTLWEIRNYLDGLYELSIGGRNSGLHQGGLGVVRCGP